MEDFHKRLIEEKDQLDEKINKLESFVGSEKLSELGQPQQALLKVQLHTMMTYSECLSQRLGLLQ